MSYSRRDLSLLLPALAAAVADAQTNKNLPAKAFKFEDLPVRVNGQNKSRAVLNGETYNHYPVELHITELGPGQEPHPPHKHVHEELLFIREGEMEVTINGQATHLGPGSCAYLASNDLHGYRNPGTAPVKYFVLALGTD